MRKIISIMVGLIVAGALLSEGSVYATVNKIVVIGDEGVLGATLRLLDPVSGYGVVVSAKTFNLTEVDALAVGDVNGDGDNEIAVSGFEGVLGPYLRVIDPSQSYNIIVNVPAGNIGLSTIDLLSVANVTVNSGNEVVVIGDEGIAGPTLRVLSPSGGYGIVASAKTFNLTEVDALATGDVNGDGDNEIAVAGFEGLQGPYLRVIDPSASPGYKIIASVPYWDIGLTSIDLVDIAGGLVYVIGDEGDAGPTLRVLNPSSGYGIVASAKTYNLTEVNALAVGDVNGDGDNEIAVAGFEGVQGPYLRVIDPSSAYNIIANVSAGNISLSTIDLLSVADIVVNTAPVAICQDITVYLDGNGKATITASDVNDGSYDPDGNSITLSIDEDIFDCSNIGANTVTLTVNDGSLSDTCDATVTVVDDLPPVVAGCDLIQVDGPGRSANNMPSASANFRKVVIGSASDKCGIATVIASIDGITVLDGEKVKISIDPTQSIGKIAGGPKDYTHIIGPTGILTVTSTDVNGNVGTCEVTP